MNVCNIDIETYSEVNIKYGVYAYAAHPSTRIMVICWSFDNGPVQSWTEWEQSDLSDFIAILKDPSVQLRAYNAQFERVVLNSHAGQQLGVPATRIQQWNCTAVQAAMHALPRGLGDCAKALGTHPKDDAGKKVMLALSKPRTAGQYKGLPWQYTDRPEDFETLKAYCMDDVRAEQAISNMLPQMVIAEQDMYHLDQEINDRGIAVDSTLAKLIVEQWPKQKHRLNTRCKALTGVGVTQVKELTAWLGMDSLGADKIRDALPAAEGDVKEVLELRQEASKTSVTKFETLLQALSPDSRLRGTLLFNGAQTGRWTGRIVQLHNLPRNTASNPEELIAELKQNPELLTGNLAQQLIRPAFIGDPGLLIGDYASIELRVTLWYADDQDKLAKVRQGLDMYKDLATSIYGVPLNKITKDHRFVGKQAVLGLGYGMGAKRFIDYCANQGNAITRALADHTVSTYRDQYETVVDSWVVCERAAIKAVKNPGKPVLCLGGRVKYVVRGNFLYCVLPSGRPISYPFPKVENKPTPWGGEKAALTYMTVNQYTRKWQREATFAGRLFQNIVQATAADLLRHSLRLLHDEEFYTVLTVHDEVVAEGAENQLPRFTELMTLTPDWADGLPVAVETVFSKRYLK